MIIVIAVVDRLSINILIIININIIISIIIIVFMFMTALEAIYCTIYECQLDCICFILI